MTRQALSTLVSGTACYGVCIGFSVGQAMQSAPIEWLPVAIDVAVPGLATLTFFLLSSLVPNLVPNRTLGFPSNLTLPAVFVALMAAWASLLGTMRHSVVAVPEPLIATTSWGQSERWVPALIGQVAALTLLVLVRRE